MNFGGKYSSAITDGEKIGNDLVPQLQEDLASRTQTPELNRILSLPGATQLPLGCLLQDWRFLKFQVARGDGRYQTQQVMIEIPSTYKRPSKR